MYIFRACSQRADAAMYGKWLDTRPGVGGVYYGDGYCNALWIESQFARPKVEYSEEVVEDGYGYQLPVYRWIQQQTRLQRLSH